MSDSITLFHVALGVGERSEAKLGVKAVGILRGEGEAAERLQPWVRQHGLNKRFAQTVAAVCVEYEHVANPAVGRVVRDNASQADLVPGRRIHADAKRILQRAFDDFARNITCPIALPAKIAVNHFRIEARRIVGEQIVAVPNLVGHKLNSIYGPANSAQLKLRECGREGGFVLGFEEGRTGDKRVGTRGTTHRCRGEIDAAVDFEAKI